MFWCFSCSSASSPGASGIEIPNKRGWGHDPLKIIVFIIIRSLDVKSYFSVDLRLCLVQTPGKCLMSSLFKISAISSNRDSNPPILRHPKLVSIVTVEVVLQLGLALDYMDRTIMIFNPSTFKNAIFCYQHQRTVYTNFFVSRFIVKILI